MIEKIRERNPNIKSDSEDNNKVVNTDVIDCEHNYNIKKELTEEKLKSNNKNKIQNRYRNREKQWFVCNRSQCHKRFQTRLGLESHYRRHKKSLKYKCLFFVCLFATNDINMFRLHRHKHQKDVRLYSSGQLLSNKSIESLETSHKNEEINENSEHISDSEPNLVIFDDFVNEIEFICDNEEPVSVLSEQINQTIVLNESIEPIVELNSKNTELKSQLVCNICSNGRVYKSRGILRIHKLRYHSNNEYIHKCLYPECEQQLSLQHPLVVKHMNQHLSDPKLKAFKCEENGCPFETENYNFMYKHVLKKHKCLQLKKEKTHKCQYTGCEKSFFTYEYLEINRKSFHMFQTGDKYYCPISGCNRRHGLSKHLKSNSHPKSAVKNIFKFFCKLCDFRTDKKFVLKRHDSNVHQIDEQSEDISDSESKIDNELDSVYDHYLAYNPISDVCPPFKCPIIGCNKEFAEKSVVSKHIIVSSDHLDLKFDPSFEYKCDFCSFRCRRKDLLDRHSLSIHWEHQFSCEYCEKKFSNRHSLDSHLISHSEVVKKVLKCHVNGCHQRFNSNFKRTAHMKRDHNIVKTFPCDYPDCDFVANYPSQLKQHKYRHRGVNPYVCQWTGCEFSCDTTHKLTAHRVSHPWPGVDIEHNVFRCDLCDYRNKLKILVKRHFNRKHTTNFKMDYKCDICHKSYANYSGVNAHKRRVHMNIIYKCGYSGCEASFKTQIQRSDHHLKVHSKKYQCDWPGCEFICDRPYKLRDHRNSHIGESCYVCDWPDSGFKAKNNFNLKHHKYRHTGELPYPCSWPECGKRFRTGPVFATHMRMHRKDLCYKCVLARM